jgi:peptidyl-prolyl cis-trans isomerase C
VRARELKVESRAEADSLYTLLLEGSKFDSLARERSIAPSKARGGDLGFLQKGRHPELDSVIFALSPGELSPVLELPDGYVIVTVEERIPAQLQSFEQVQSRIDERLRRQKLNQVYERYTKELMSAAQIERFEAGDTLALVNSHPITEQEFEARVAQLPPFARSGLDTPEGRSQFLDQLILERLLRERAEAEDLWLREPVQAQLRSARQAILVRELYRLKVIEPSSVDSNQVRDYYEANQDEFRVGERVRARELKVGSRAEADSLYRYLTRRPGILGWILGPPKVDFDSLARERSVAPTKAKGGDLGYFTRDEKPEIAAVAFKLKPGQISKVIPVEDGFVILKVDARNPSRIKPLSEVFNQIQGRLRTERQKELEAELYSRLRGEHQIQTFLSE